MPENRSEVKNITEGMIKQAVLVRRNRCVSVSEDVLPERNPEEYIGTITRVSERQELVYLARVGGEVGVVHFDEVQAVVG